MAHAKPRLRQTRQWRSGKVAVPLRNGQALVRHVFVPLGGMVDIAVHELGASLTLVEDLPTAPGGRAAR